MALRMVIAMLSLVLRRIRSGRPYFVAYSEASGVAVKLNSSAHAHSGE